MQGEQTRTSGTGHRAAACVARLAVGGSLALLPLAALAASPATRSATRPVALVPGATPAASVVASVTAATKPIDTTRTYLLHLPGIAGETQIDHRLVNGMKGAGFAGPTEIYDWTGEQKGIAALTNREHNDKEAQKIADKIAARRKADPGGQILLTGHSGGTGLAVFALEKLPKGVTVDGLLLLSPALSPTYDLSKALSHVRGKAYCFSSSLDVFVLGFGTTLFGTIDGKKGESAGRVGFVKPEAPADPAQYDKLVNCPYDKAWIRFGNIGDHVTIMTEAFTEHVLAPMVKSLLPGGGGPLTRPTVP
jgi:pimeloyl-ACP methyl ester carboxylesterase